MTRNHGFLVAGAAVLAAAAVLVSRESAPPAVTPPGLRSANGIASPPGDVDFRKSRRPASRPPQALADLPSPAVSPHPPGSPEDLGWIAGRIAELDQLAAAEDSESLDEILGDLRNPLPEIRAAALAATQAFGSRDAIPALEAIAARTSEPAERKSLADAVEFLRLPTLVERLDLPASAIEDWKSR